jgi:DNA-binding MarR family transcriptional regulator
MNDTHHRTDSVAELRSLLGLFWAEVMRCDTDDMFRLLKREDLSMPRIVALGFVARRGAVSISEISGFLDLSLGNTSMLVDKLVCQGFVTRAEDASDRRQKVIQLTTKGQAFVDELRATRVNQLAQQMLLLPPDLLARAIDVLSEVTAQLSQISTEHSAERAQEIVRRP